MWLIFALLSAVFASLTSVFAKIGIENVNSNLATAIRTVVVLVMAWGIVFFNNSHSNISQISTKSWIFLILSGIATGASWLCYFYAIQIGEVFKVASVDKLSIIITLVLSFFVLGENITPKTFIGGLLIAIGTIIMIK